MHSPKKNIFFFFLEISFLGTVPIWSCSWVKSAWVFSRSSKGLPFFENITNMTNLFEKTGTCMILLYCLPGDFFLLECLTAWRSGGYAPCFLFFWKLRVYLLSFFGKIERNCLTFWVDLGINNKGFMYMRVKAYFGCKSRTLSALVPYLTGSLYMGMCKSK